MPRANRHYIPDQIWHIVSIARPWASRHKNIHVQNTLLSQERILTKIQA